jgi:hypothetical protein
MKLLPEAGAPERIYVKGKLAKEAGASGLHGGPSRASDLGTESGQRGLWERDQSIGKSPDPPYGSRLSRRDGHSLLGLCHRFQSGDRLRLGQLPRRGLRLDGITPKDQSNVKAKYREPNSAIHLNLSLLQRPFPRLVVAPTAQSRGFLSIFQHQYTSFCRRAHRPLGRSSYCTFGQSPFVRLASQQRLAIAEHGSMAWKRRKDRRRYRLVPPQGPVVGTFLDQKGAGLSSR